uniref:Reverse transcriptase domain-containing protein n=1 Tax=Timema monikensis TaxID=170555 RepID=A0A7R9EGL9_9NEOP|nr:unnamed protein product [Timema monikensis]
MGTGRILDISVVRAVAYLAEGPGLDSRVQVYNNFTLITQDGENMANGRINIVVTNYTFQFGLHTRIRNDGVLDSDFIQISIENTGIKKGMVRLGLSISRCLLLAGNRNCKFRLIRGRIKRFKNKRTSLTRCANIVEAKGVCKDREVWRKSLTQNVVVEEGEVDDINESILAVVSNDYNTNTALDIEKGITNFAEFAYQDVDLTDYLRYHLLENTVIDIQSYSRDLLEDRRRYIMNDFNGVVRLNDIRRDITTETMYVSPFPQPLNDLKKRISAAVEMISEDILGAIWAELDYRLNGYHMNYNFSITYLRTNESSIGSVSMIAKSMMDVWKSSVTKSDFIRITRYPEFLGPIFLGSSVIEHCRTIIKEVKEGFDNQINLCRDRGLNHEPQHRSPTPHPYTTRADSVFVNGDDVPEEVRQLIRTLLKENYKNDFGDGDSMAVVQRPEKFVVQKGKNQVGAITCCERGQNVTGLYAVSATCFFIPPMLIYTRKRMKESISFGAPPCTIFCCQDKGADGSRRKVEKRGAASGLILTRISHKKTLETSNSVSPKQKLKKMERKTTVIAEMSGVTKLNIFCVVKVMRKNGLNVKSAKEVGVTLLQYSQWWSGRTVVEREEVGVTLLQYSQWWSGRTVVEREEVGVTLLQYSQWWSGRTVVEREEVGVTLLQYSQWWSGRTVVEREEVGVTLLQYSQWWSGRTVVEREEVGVTLLQYSQWWSGRTVVEREEVGVTLLQYSQWWSGRTVVEREEVGVTLLQYSQWWSGRTVVEREEVGVTLLQYSQWWSGRTVVEREEVGVTLLQYSQWWSGRTVVEREEVGVTLLQYSQWWSGRTVVEREEVGVTLLQYSQWWSGRTVVEREEVGVTLLQYSQWWSGRTNFAKRDNPNFYLQTTRLTVSNNFTIDVQSYAEEMYTSLIQRAVTAVGNGRVSLNNTEIDLPLLTTGYQHQKYLLIRGHIKDSDILTFWSCFGRCDTIDVTIRSSVLHCQMSDTKAATELKTLISLTQNVVVEEGEVDEDINENDDVTEDTEEHQMLRERMENDEYVNEEEVEPVSRAEVIRNIALMGKKKAPGPDGIKVEVLERTADLIAPFLAAHMEGVMGKTLSVMNKIISMGQRRFYLTMRIIRTYHQMILLSIVSYGACIWAHRLTNVAPAKAIQGLQRNILLRLTGAYRTVATDALSVALGVWPLDLLIRKKAVAYWLKKRNLEKVRLLTTHDVRTFGEAEIVLLEEWQRRWERSGTGRRTYQLFPNVVERLENKHLQPSRGLVHFITGKGPYPASLRKLGLIESGNCQCGEEGTPEHVVLECVITLEARRNYQREIQGRLVGEVLRDPIYWKFLDQIALEASDRAKTAYIDRLKEAQGRIRRDVDTDNDEEDDSDTEGGTDTDTSAVSAGSE